MRLRELGKTGLREVLTDLTVELVPGNAGGGNCINDVAVASFGNGFFMGER